MAIYHTDNILGNDTTGNGTAENPWKTITKALPSCINNDTIRVAGSGFTPISGTLSISFSSATVGTSVSQVGVIAVGTLISINDPILGNRTGLHRVTAVTATTITVATNINFASGNYTGEFLTQNHYGTAAASQNFEDFSTVAINFPQNIAIEAGWTGGFTAQNGITGVSYTATSGSSGTIFRISSSVQNFGGYIFNNWAFSGITPWSGSAYTFNNNATQNPQKLGNIWFLTSGTVQVCAVNAPSGCNLHMNTTSQVTFALPSVNTLPDFVINNMYVIANPGNNPLQNYNYRTSINNLWLRAWDSQGFFSASVRTPTGVGTYNILNYNIVWTVPLNSPQFVALFSGGFNIVRNINQLGNYPSINPNNRPLAIRANILANVQVIMPTQNITTVIPNLSGYGQTNPLDQGTQSTCPVLDIEGDKIILNAGSLIQADSTEYSTGTNSLKLRKDFAATASISTANLINIDSFYLPNPSTPKTITIRAKASANTFATFRIEKNGNFGVATTVAQPANLTQTLNLTTNWADYTFTPLQTQSNVDLYAGTYVYLSVSMNTTLTAEYIWIDSVTVS